MFTTWLPFNNTKDRFNSNQNIQKHNYANISVCAFDDSPEQIHIINRHRVPLSEETACNKQNLNMVVNF